MTTAARIMALFEGRAGVSGTHGTPVRKPGTQKWEIKSTAQSLREPVTEALWQKHLDGVRPLGVVPVREDNTCLWGSIDVDDYDRDLIKIIQAVEQQKFPLVPCRSKSGGLHLFMFLSEPVPAGAIQAVLRDLAARLGLAGCEIFPKQSMVLAERGDVGNWMVMPYFGHTYEGKIKEQVGLKRTGAEMLVEEFLSSAEAARITADGMDNAGSRARPGKTKKNGTGPSGSDFADGPPCLQHLASMGVPPGGQNNALFHMGVYYQKAHPEDWRDHLERANRELLRPPGSAEGLTSVIKSLSAKEYQYTCKNEPMAGHCNSVLCRTRKFGVGDGGNFPIISGLSKLDTTPPIWFVDVEGQRVEASTEQLQNYMLFHRLCMDRLNTCYRMMKPVDWLSSVAQAMESVTLIEAPPDVGVSGHFRELMEEFLVNRASGQNKEDLFTGRPWKDEENDCHRFRLRDLQDFLVRQNMKDLKRGQITQMIRDMGGEDAFLNIKGRGCQHWRLPSTAVESMPEVPPPRPAPHPI